MGMENVTNLSRQGFVRMKTRVKLSFERVQNTLKAVGSKANDNLINDSETVNMCKSLRRSF